MAGAQASIRSFTSPSRGLGKTAPSLLHDILLYNPPAEPGRHVLSDPASNFQFFSRIRDALPAALCVHEFLLQPRQTRPPALDERPTADSVFQAAGICWNCQHHVVVKIDYTVAWRDRPCPNEHNPLHHFVTSQWRQDDANRELQRSEPGNDTEIYVYECTSKTCSAVATVYISPPVLVSEAVNYLVDKDALRKRTTEAFELNRGHTEGMKEPSPSDVLSDLRKYIVNALTSNGQSRAEIRLDNKRFAVRFGPEGRACVEVLEYIGFTLKPGEAWLVPALDASDKTPYTSLQNVYLDNIVAELDILLLKRPVEDRLPAHEQARLERADAELMRVLGCQNYPKTAASRTSRLSILDRPTFYMLLGVPQDAADDLVIFAYQRQTAMASTNFREHASLLSALEEVQRERNSESINQLVATEHSLGKNSHQSIATAYRTFDVQPHDKVDDDLIIGRFQSILQDSPTQYEQLREHLAVIAQDRNSKRLHDFVTNRLATLDDALNFLGADQSTDDEFVITLYTSKVVESPAQIETAQKALQMIANERQSIPLQAYIANNYTGDISNMKMDLAQAYETLGVDDRTMESENLYMVYTVRLDESPGDAARFQQAIRVIAEETNDPFLKAQFDEALPNIQTHSTTQNKLFEPVGLENIGNTCYLNSLLQWLYTMLPVRKVVLEYEQKYKREGGAERAEGKRIGQRAITNKDIETAQSFVPELAMLFNKMMYAPTQHVGYTYDLAKLTLETKEAQTALRTGRRSSTVTSRRMTLGTIDSRPVLGPLPPPEAIFESATMTESPDLDKSAGTDPIQAGASKIVPLEQAEIAPSAHINVASTDAQTGGPSIPDTTMQDASTPASSVTMSDASSDTIAATPQDEDITQETNDSVRGETFDLDTAHREREMLDNTNLSDQAPTDNVTMVGDRTITYAPPPGPPPNKPPPVPPRPGTKATQPSLDEYARQQDVTEVAGHAINQLSYAINPKGYGPHNEQLDEIHDTFYGYEQECVLAGNATPTKPNEFLYVIAPVSNHPRDLYGALDNQFDAVPREDGTLVYGSITKLPPILTIFVGRAVFEGGAARKENHHIDLPQTLFMDRYMEAEPDSELFEIRKKTWRWKQELSSLLERQAKLEPRDAIPADEVINQAMSVINHIGTINFSPLGTTLSNIDSSDDVIAQLTSTPLTFPSDVLSHLRQASQLLASERATNASRIAYLQEQLSRAFYSTEYQKQGYTLHAAFFHRGTVGSGHYWVYILDHANPSLSYPFGTWRKYNDEYVSIVQHPQVEIFGNPAEDRNNPNATGPANPYFLVYVRQDQLHELVETVKREPVQAEFDSDIVPLGQSANNFYNSEAHTQHVEDAPGAGQTRGQRLGQMNQYMSQMSYMPPEGRPPTPANSKPVALNTYNGAEETDDHSPTQVSPYQMSSGHDAALAGMGHGVSSLNSAHANTSTVMRELHDSESSSRFSGSDVRQEVSRRGGVDEADRQANLRSMQIDGNSDGNHDDGDGGVHGGDSDDDSGIGGDVGVNSLDRTAHAGGSRPSDLSASTKWDGSGGISKSGNW